MKLKLIQMSLITIFLSAITVTHLQAHEHGAADESEFKRHPELTDEERADMREKIRDKRKKYRKKRILELDTNGDDQVDLTEYLANAERRFNELDADGNGYVTAEEAKARHKELRKKHHKMRKKARQEVLEEGTADQ